MLIGKEYIERNELIDNLNRFAPEHYTGLLNMLITKQPAVDVVEVVRCKDCRYFTEGMAVGMCKRVENKPIIPCCFDNFCSYGERRTDNDL